MQKSKQSVIPLVMVINNLAALITKDKTENQREFLIT